MRKLGPQSVHPGRGEPGGASLLDEEEQYLKKVIDLVAAEKPKMPPKDDALERIEKAIVASYPDYGFPIFLKIGLPAEWERQAKGKK
jgi:hypothetical protein